MIFSIKFKLTLCLKYFKFTACYNFKTTATKSELTSYELDCLGFRKAYIIRIDICEENGKVFQNRLPEQLVQHLWTVLGQNLDNLDRFRTARIPGKSFRITYKVKEPLHLPHVSKTAKFDFYQCPTPDAENPDVKLTVFQSILVGQSEE